MSQSQSQRNRRSTAAVVTNGSSSKKSMEEIAALSYEDYLNYIGNFKPGSITKICLQNFLTYKSVVIRPGPRLNVVAGANGTGKSTILNAICLGLGGEPKLLGRAEDVRDFVMHNETVAEIEISLAPPTAEDQPQVNNNLAKENLPPPPHVIKRVIDKRKGTDKGKGRGSSIFYLNGEKVSVKEIQQLVRDLYSIQIENLCTFLPQDKVGSFSALSPQELLLETEKVLAKDGYYIDTHRMLMQQQDTLQDDESDLNALQAKLKKLKQDQEQLERAKQKMEERLEALQQLDLLKKKAMWLEFESLRLQAIELRTTKAQVRERLRQAAQELQPLQEQVEALEARVKQNQAQQHLIEKRQRAAQMESDKQAKKYETHDDDIEQGMLDLELLDENHAKAMEKVEQCQQRLDLLEQDRSKFTISVEEMQQVQREAVARRRQAQEEYNAAKHHAAQLQREFNAISREEIPEYVKRVAKLSDVANRRKDHVFRQFTNLARVCKWIDDHRDQFRRPVVGPIAAELQPTSPQAAAFLEQHVPKNTLKAFCVETKEDQDFLYRKVRQELGIPINIMLLRRGTTARPRFYSSQKMRVLQTEYGIQGYLDEILGPCPDMVRQALIDTAAVDRVLVGNEQTYDNMKAVQQILSSPEQPGGQRQSFVVCCLSSSSTNGRRSSHGGGHRQQLFKFQGNKSRYANELSVRQDDILPARILSAAGQEDGVDHAFQLQQAQAALEDAHRRLNEDLRPQMLQAEKDVQEKETLYQESQAAMTVASRNLEIWNKYIHKYQQAARNLKEAQDAVASGDQELEIQKKNLLETIMNRVRHSLKALDARAEQQAVFMETTADLVGLAANKSCLMVEKRMAELAQVDKKQSFEALNKEGERVQREFARVKKEVADKNAMCMRVAPIQDEDGNDLPLREQMDSLGVDTLDQVEVAIEEAEGRINSIDANPDVLRQYEVQKKNVEELEVKIDQMIRDKAHKTSELDSNRRRWEMTLEEQISVMNSLFAKYMSEMGNAGELMLYKGEPDEHGNYGNFKEWGLKILVSFRGESRAQVLSAQSHSGGERAVSTIMYLMGCQDMLVAPFRCVDEINQGLDERNERLVFSRIVANSCSLPPKTNPLDHSGQYFLITPKLLPNLEDMDNPGITVLTVINGPYNCIEDLRWESLLDLLSSSQGKKTKKRSIKQDESEDDVGQEDEDNDGDVDVDDHDGGIHSNNLKDEDDDEVSNDHENREPNSAHTALSPKAFSSRTSASRKKKRLS